MTQATPHSPTPRLSRAAQRRCTGARSAARAAHAILLVSLLAFVLLALAVTPGGAEADVADQSAGGGSSLTLRAPATAVRGNEPTWPNPFGLWTKYAGNPVWDDGSVGNTVVKSLLWDFGDPLKQPLLYPHPTHGPQYWMAYASLGSGGAIRLAYSADLLHWRAYGQNPIVRPAAGELYVSSPNLFKHGGQYMLMYDVGTTRARGETQFLSYATAPTPLGPWTKGPMILDVGAAGAWDEGRVTEPFLLRDGDTYYLYYMGDAPAPFGRAEQVGLATTPAASFPDGPWIKQGLILPIFQDNVSWDRGLTADPSILKVDDIFFMLYTGSYANINWKLGIAWATHPAGPWHRPQKPFLTPGPAAWDTEALVRGSIHYLAGKFYLFYSGLSGGRFRAGLAVGDPLATPTPVPHQCANYWYNCVPDTSACPVGKVDDPAGVCGAGWKCCIPKTP